MTSLDTQQLLKDLKKQVKALEEDLRERAEEPEFGIPLREEYEHAVREKRTSSTAEIWIEEAITQAAIAWALNSVFLRFVEDNGLIANPYITGPGERAEDAIGLQQDYFTMYPERTYRDWILAGITEMSQASRSMACLFDSCHNPMWLITPSDQAAKELISFWRQKDETGGISRNFTDPEWDTRFLGDFYEELSDHARELFALRQTPEFVEKLLLDLTLDSAIDEFGIEPGYPLPEIRPDLQGQRGIRIIDPACGSGHFLLAAFERLMSEWQRRRPGLDSWEQVKRVLCGIHGVDKNPYAVAIARFRLAVAAMRATGESRFCDAPDFQVNVAVGDSLLHGRGTWRQKPLPVISHVFATEDVAEFIESVDILGIGSYHVVVGNPPYITVKDDQESKNYRTLYRTCHRQYSLAVPFAERFFQLGIRDAFGEQGAGYIGQITTNSFARREFGKKLVEEYFRDVVEVTHVLDTSGAYIPGHGTSTVIIVGRNSYPKSTVPIRVVIGLQGEPEIPLKAALGRVWSSIVQQARGQSGSDRWTASVDRDRMGFFEHPWRIVGGEGWKLLGVIEEGARTLGSLGVDIGCVAVTREDSIYLLGKRVLDRLGISRRLQRAVVEGRSVRDWRVTNPNDSFWPYDSDTLRACIDLKSRQVAWPFRTRLRERIAYGKTQIERGLKWFEYSMFFTRRFEVPVSIVFSEISSHSHFALSVGETVFNRTAPAIRAKDGGKDLHHRQLLVVLNSSTVCFWLKQNCYDKGNGGIGGGISSEMWERRYVFNSTRLTKLPIPDNYTYNSNSRMLELSKSIDDHEPSAVVSKTLPNRNDLDSAREQSIVIRRQMIAMQEELDWSLYVQYGILDANLQSELADITDVVPGIEFGERAFEIVMARRMLNGELETEWFSRHGSTPVTEIPSRWPSWYQDLVQRRIDCIESRPDIALIEQPEYKRRWNTAPWEKREHEALRSWLLDYLEHRELWFAEDHTGAPQPQPQTVNRLADRLRSDTDFASVAALFAGPDTDLARILADLVSTDHVPYLSAHRYKDSGLRKRAQWETTWELQREEDRTGQRLDIKVPPKYTSADFRRPSYWRQRGKLDVPKERFISYPDANPDNDDSLLLGWAGWDHREQAHALTMLILNRTENLGWSPSRVTPLLAGLAEQLPWVAQWHADIDPELGASPADIYSDFLNLKQQELDLNDEDLSEWRPPTRPRRRKKKSP